MTSREKVEDPSIRNCRRRVEGLGDCSEGAKEWEVECCEVCYQDSRYTELEEEQGLIDMR